MSGNRRQRAATAIPLPLLLTVLVVLLPATTRAQAVPRTDTPRAGTLRFTFEPIISTWEREFTANGREQRIGASLPTNVLVREERRVTAFALDFGITNRIAVGVNVPLVRVNTHATYPLDSLGAQAPDSAAQALDSLLQDTTYAFDPIANTSRRLRYFAGDVEVQAKYRMLETHSFALSGALVLRLPTGHQDSPNNVFDLSTGDHQTDIELQAAQEVTLLDRLWLNASIRVARQQPGTRERRVGPQTTLLLPYAALARLNWDPGDYAALDVAPMYRFTRSFALGVTAGYWTKQRDHYSYRSAQDSTDVSTNLGAPAPPASVLDPGTSERWLRLGAALTYMGSGMEGSLSFEQTVSGSGAHVPAASVFRIVMRTSRWPF